MVIFQCAKIMLFSEIEKTFDKKTASRFFFKTFAIRKGGLKDGEVFKLPGCRFATRRLQCALK